ncbi:MAG: lipocalin family protein [Bacteroidetes bacterium]|nr:lipocalin family protein [Bacteroidota bacterium]
MKYSLKALFMIPALALAFAGASCKKNKDDKKCDINMASIAGTYRLASLKYKPGAGQPEQDVMPMRDACENDDLVTLNANGTYHYQDAGTVCTPSGNDDGTWSLNGNTLSSDGDMRGDIKSFDCSSLSYTIKDIYNTGDELVFTLKRQ